MRLARLASSLPLLEPYVLTDILLFLGRSPFALQPLANPCHCFLQIVAYAAGLVVYRIWFHPLSKYPGPKLQAAWYLPHLYHNHVVGDGVRRVARQHVKYGPIVRIGPNHLSIDGSIGWKDIYAHHAGKEEFRKSVVPTPGADQTLIVAPKDAHRRMRRQLAHAFSDAALIEQESVVVDYLDLLISRLTERVGTEINMVSWFNFTTFDIIGDLAFSDPFDSLASNGYHPWVLSIFEGIRSASQRRLLHNYPILFRLIELLPASISPVGALAILRNNAGSKVTARMEKGEDGGKGRRDFLSYMMRKTRDGKAGMSEGEIRNSTPTVVIAGSETTATALSGLMFYLKQYPDTYDKLVNEIRTSFTSESEITMQSTAKLEYLQACLQEILRVYPPVPETPSRLSPGAEVDGEYMPKDVSSNHV